VAEADVSLSGLASHRRRGREGARGLLRRSAHLGAFSLLWKPPPPPPLQQQTASLAKLLKGGLGAGDGRVNLTQANQRGNNGDVV